MTFTNTDTLDQAVKAFKRLPVDDQLAALASIYTAASGSLSSSASGIASSKDVGELVKQVKEMRPDEQVQLLRDVFSNQKTQGEEEVLDPHPSKALLELIPGGVTPPLSKYDSLDTNSRLGFLYQLAQEISLPTDYQLSSEATELLNSLKSVDFDQQVKFLSQVV